MQDERAKGANGMDIDHRGPARCTDCGQDAYIQLAIHPIGSDDYVCAHCFADRGRAAREAAARDAPRASLSPLTGSAEGAGQ